jgi:hypothetical protein
MGAQKFDHGRLEETISDNGQRRSVQVNLRSHRIAERKIQWSNAADAKCRLTGEIPKGQFCRCRRISRGRVAAVPVRPVKIKA